MGCFLTIVRGVCFANLYQIYNYDVSKGKLIAMVRFEEWLGQVDHTQKTHRSWWWDAEGMKSNWHIIACSSSLANHIQVKGGRNMKYRLYKYTSCQCTSLTTTRIAQRTLSIAWISGWCGQHRCTKSGQPTQGHPQQTKYLVTFLKYGNMTIKKLNVRFMMMMMIMMMMMMMTMTMTMTRTTMMMQCWSQ